eukprot:COSAG01_NODE_19384_length_1012_cov_188.431544_3_plen_149_part_01
MINSRTFVGRWINMWDCMFCGKARTRIHTSLGAGKNGTTSCGTRFPRRGRHGRVGLGHTYLKNLLDVVLRQIIPCKGRGVLDGHVFQRYCFPGCRPQCTPLNPRGSTGLRATQDHQTPRECARCAGRVLTAGGCTAAGGRYARAGAGGT